MMDGPFRLPTRAVLAVSGLYLALAGAACGNTPTTSAPSADASPSGASSPTNSPGPSASAAPTSAEKLPSLSATAPVALTPMDRFHTDFPQDLVIDFDAVWTANENIDTVTRIDPGSGEVTSIKVTPGLGPQTIEAAGDSIWTSGTGGIDRIDPATNSVTSHIDAGLATSLIYAFDSLWAGGHDGLIRIDPESGSIEGTIETSDVTQRPPETGCGVSAAAGSLWMSCGDTVDRVDPDTGAIVATIRPGGSVVSAGRWLWLMTSQNPFQEASPDLTSASVDRINTETNEVIAGTTVSLVQGAAVNMGLGDGDVIWFPTTFGEEQAAGMLYKFDAASGTVVSAFDISEGKGYGSNAIAFGYGSLWAASGQPNQVRRFQMPSD